jgi:ribosome-associated protein
MRTRCSGAATLAMDCQAANDGEPREGVHLEPMELARKAVDAASDRQAADIVLLDIRSVSLLADYFVICSAETERQVKAVVDSVVEALEKEGQRPLHIEGNAASGWVLLDYGSVIVHVFSPAEREYYHLERLWAQAQTVLRMQ